MLKDLLIELNSSDAFSNAKVAKNLGLTEEFVQEGVSQLIRMGYLKEEFTTPTCSGGCGSCAVANCNTINIKTFSITDKGINLLAN